MHLSSDNADKFPHFLTLATNLLFWWILKLLLYNSVFLRFGFPDGLVDKEFTRYAGDTRDVGLTPGWEDPLEKGIATHYSILAWKIPWIEEPSGYSPKGGKESDTLNEYAQCMTVFLNCLAHIKTKG